MIDYVKGKIEEITPTDLVVDCNGIGFHAQISIQTYSKLEKCTEAKVYMHHVLREDEELFYGFADKDERELFRLLISVSGVGVGTARMMLSSLTCDEIREAIISENVTRIKAVKGIGLKSAQRIILELKDKVLKGEGAADSTSILFGTPDNSIVEEATTALVMLGFTKANVSKVVTAIIKEQPSATIETIIKLALKKL
ncbi:MAG: Holliday junction branch migration protein RuvA [Bacteroidales bacterium]|nr:Holliday junction branch migration protein RuvA [Candidatus Cryptobacteroides caccocaballi]